MCTELALTRAASYPFVLCGNLLRTASRTHTVCPEQLSSWASALFSFVHGGCSTQPRFPNSWYRLLSALSLSLQHKDAGFPLTVLALQKGSIF